MNFIEMWQEADRIDAEIGGMDSMSEEEQYDYQAGLLIALADDFEYGRCVATPNKSKEGTE